MRYALALVCLCALTIPGVALADQGNTTAPTQCTPLKTIYAERDWQDPKPADGRTACPPRRREGRRSTIRHFYEYRHYRQIATMRCTGGTEGWFVPNPGSCSTIECESHFSWHAYNPSSGADGAYQLLGHGEPFPANSFHERLIHHEIASTLPRSAWVC